MRRFLILSIFGLAFSLSAPTAAQDRETPYWATLRVDEVNLRVGPSEEYPIDWVYRREGLPMKVVRLQGGWRLVEDPDGARGWIVARLLNPDRGAIVTGEDEAEMREEPGGNGRLLWRLEPGVVGRLGDCRDGWCRLDVKGRAGWVPQGRLWGAGEP